MNRAVVALGSNVEPRVNVRAALARLAADHDLRATSDFHTTEPVGPIRDQPDFVNGAALVATDLGRDGFEAYLKDVERDLGRDRQGEKWGPRRIDLDLVVWNGRVVDEDVYARRYLRDEVEAVWPGVT